MTVKRTFIIFCFTVVLSLWCTVLLAQPGSGPPGDPPNPDVPITGLEYLLGGGILYGIRSLIKARKKSGD
jgi:hypothetical protein